VGAAFERRIPETQIKWGGFLTAAFRRRSRRAAAISSSICRMLTLSRPLRLA
jgi:hypothetical protein